MAGQTVVVTVVVVGVVVVDVVVDVDVDVVEVVVEVVVDVVVEVVVGVLVVVVDVVVVKQFAGTVPKHPSMIRYISKLVLLENALLRATGIIMNWATGKPRLKQRSADVSDVTVLARFWNGTV